MNKELARNNYDKTCAAVEKRKIRNAKLADKIAKLRQTLVASGVWDSDSNKRVGDVWQYDEATRKSIWDLEDWENQLEESEKKLREDEAKKERQWQTYLKAAAEQKKVDELPPAVIELRDNLTDEYIKYYREIKQEIKDAIQKDRAEGERIANEKGLPPYRYTGYEENYEALCKKYGRKFISNVRMMSDSDIVRDGNEYGRHYVIDLMARVTKHVGNITDTSRLHTNGYALNGIVEGEGGIVRLETILAGGWNIQRLHNRVMIKPILKVEE